MNKDLFDENDDKYIKDFFKDKKQLEFNIGYALGKEAIKKSEEKDRKNIDNKVIQNCRDGIVFYDRILECLSNYDISSAVYYINAIKETLIQELNKLTYEPKVEDITKQDKLEVLDFLIDLSLKENSKKLFNQYTKEKNELLAI